MITINIDKAKAIAHDMRRAARTAEFAPLDEVIAKKIPGTDEQAIEVQRQNVREKYAVMQTQIDNADNVDAIKAVLPK